MKTQYLSILLIVLSVNVATVEANEAPIAYAGPDQYVSFGDEVMLQGSVSDANGPVTYHWAHISGPWKPALSDPDVANPTFTASLMVQSVIFQLTVTDEGGATATDEVNITVLEDAENAVFASSVYGNDNWTGLRRLPVKSLQRAVELASSREPHADIYVHEGVYKRTKGVYGPLVIEDGMSIYGGFEIILSAPLPEPGSSAVNGQWKRTVPSSFPVSPAAITLEHPTTFYGDSTAIELRNVRTPTTIDGLIIEALDGAFAQGFDGAGENSIVIYISDCNESLRITNNQIQAGRGGDGRDGIPGASGQAGLPGQDGEDAPDWALWLPCWECSHGKRPAGYCEKIQSTCAGIAGQLDYLWDRFYPIDNPDLHTRGGQGARLITAVLQQGGKGGDSYANSDSVPNAVVECSFWEGRCEDPRWSCGEDCTDPRLGYTSGEPAPYVPGSYGGHGGWWWTEADSGVLLGILANFVPGIGPAMSYGIDFVAPEAAAGLEEPRSGRIGSDGDPGPGGTGGAKEGFTTWDLVGGTHHWIGGFGLGGKTGNVGKGGGGGGAGWPTSVYGHFYTSTRELYLPGGGGGGGGGGGAPGKGGKRGSPGGASFGIFLGNSSPIIRSNIVKTTGGGDGGSGGSAGKGGYMGIGGKGGAAGRLTYLNDERQPRSINSGKGANGAHGGYGGTGGGGGGGSGGASCGIFRADRWVYWRVLYNISNNDFQIGLAGYGGAGGTGAVSVDELSRKKVEDWNEWIIDLIMTIDNINNLVPPYDTWTDAERERTVKECQRDIARWQKRIDTYKASEGEPGEDGMQGEMCPPPGDHDFQRWLLVEIDQVAYWRHYVPADMSSLYVSMPIDASNIDLSLDSPSGRIIDSNTTAPDVIHLKDSSYESYVVSNPEEGEWTFELFGADVPPEGEEVLLSVSFTPPDLPPVADAGPDQIVECTSLNGAQITLDASESYDGDCCGVLTYEWKGADAQVVGTTPQIELVLPIGIHVLTLTVSNGQKIDTDIVTITVQDTIPPVITLNGGDTISLLVGRDTYTELGATAMDISDGNVPVVIGGDEVDVSSPGTYTVMYEAMDGSGNAAQMAREIRVMEVELPEDPLESISHLANISFEHAGLDPQTGSYVVVITVSNTSQAVQIAPVMIVVNILGPSSISLRRYDAVTLDGKHVVNLSLRWQDPVLEPGETVNTQLHFDNPEQAQFFLDIGLRGLPWYESQFYDYNLDVQCQVCTGPQVLELTGDCRVDFRDFAVFASSWGAGVQPAETPSPVGHWKLDETGGKIVYDSVGQNHGEIICQAGSCIPSWHPSGGRMDGALQLNGFGDTISIPRITDSVEFTYTLWIKQNLVKPGAVALIDHKDWAPGSARFELKDGRPTVCINQATWPREALEAGEAIAVGQWHHVAVSKSVGAIAIYIDGFLAAHRQLAASNTVILGDAFIGSCSGDRHFCGLLDDIHIYDQQLSNSQIREVMKGDQGGAVQPYPLAHWKFDDTEGDIVHDSTDDHDGVLMGNPVWQPTGGAISGALMLDGASDYVLTDFVLDPASGPFSVSAWVKGDIPGQVVISQANGYDWLSTDPSTGCLATRLRSPVWGGSGLTSQIKPIIDDQWHHVVLVYNPPDSRALYVDGDKVAEDFQTDLNNSAGGMHLGAGHNLQSGRFWSGMIDDIRIYDYVTYPDEISDEIIDEVLQALGPGPSTSDFNRDGQVDISDLTSFAFDWLECYRPFQEACQE